MVSVIVFTRENSGSGARLLRLDRRNAGTILTRYTDIPAGKDRIIISMLHGINELHHTVSNRLLDYAHDDDSYPVESFVATLTEIATQYRIEGLLTAALEFPQTRDDPPK